LSLPAKCRKVFFENFSKIKVYIFKLDKSELKDFSSLFNEVETEIFTAVVLLGISEEGFYTFLKKMKALQMEFEKFSLNFSKLIG
jgi:glutathione peroxidase-family protein